MTTRIPRRSWSLISVFVFVCSVVGVPPTSIAPAEATVPGLVDRIAFAADIDGRTDIWVRDFASGSPVNLTGNIDEERQPTWSPDGGRLAYTSFGWLTGSGTIAVIDDDGSNFSLLTTTTAEDTWPSWSRDGQSIAYTSNEDGPDQDIWVVGVDSGVRTNLTSDSAAADNQPEYSPDGSKLAFVSDRSGSVDIWIMDSDGADPHNLTATTGTELGPSWSPDGSQIAFLSFPAGGFGDLYVVNVDGSGLVRLTQDAWVSGRAAWSPDQSLISYASAKDGDFDLWMVAADGSSPPGHLTDNPANEFDVAWESVSRAPVAVEDVYDVNILEPFSANLLHNDFDPDGDELTIVDLASSVALGELVGGTDGTFTYTLPDPLSVLCPDLSDHSLYVIADGRGWLDSTEIHFNVELPPAPPPAPSGPEVGQDDFRISFMGPERAIDYGAEAPVAIHNPVANEFLVVWPADDNTGSVEGEFEIWGRRLDASTGTQLGSQIRVTNYGPANADNYDAGWVAGAYNSARNEYLVVYTAYCWCSPGFLDIYGQRVASDGSLIDPGGFRISFTGLDSDTRNSAYPAIAYNSVEDEYLVVWAGDPPPLATDQVYGQRLTGEGDLLGPVIQVSTDNQGPGWMMSPDVAYNAVDNEYLAVWSASPETGGMAVDEYEVFSRRLEAGGSPIGSEFPISDLGITGQAAFDALDPSVVHNPASNQYLAVWSGADSTGLGADHDEIFGQLLGAGGMQAGVNDFAVSEMNHASWPPGDASVPAVTFDSLNREYLVTWQGSDAPFPCQGTEIFGQRLSATGAAVGADDFQVSNNNVGYDWAEGNSPHGVYNPNDSEFLVVWTGDYLNTSGASPGEYEVHGQRLAANRAPVAEPDEITVLEGESVAGDVLDNDSDPDGDPLTAVNASDPEWGSVTVGPDGSFIYVHDGSETTVDSFTYQASDGMTESNVTTVTITVTPVNDPPVATPDTFAVLEGETMTEDVLDNDLDPEGIPLQAVKVTDPAHGTLRIWVGDGSFTYEHDGSETTADSFSYRASDGMTQSDVTTVSITVTPVNDPPVAPDVTLDVQRGGYGGLYVGFDPEGDPVTVLLLSDPVHGTLTLDPEGRFDYFHDGSASTVDSFTYQLSDGASFSRVATVTFDIGPAGHTTGLVDPATGQWYLKDIRGTWMTPFYFGVPGDYPMMGDWDCDGVETPGLYRQSDGYAYLRNSNSTGVADRRFYFGIPGDIPLAGDFNGDGCDTVSVYRPSQGRVFISNQLGEDDGAFVAEYDYYFGIPGDKPFCGDFDADGVETIGLHRESSGLVYFRQHHSTGVADAEFFYGIPGDRLISGDWGAVDGVFTMGIFRPSTQTMYLRYANSLGTADYSYGAGEADWLPIAGYFGS